MQERRQPEIIAGRVNADGSIAAGDGFTAVASGANYTITFQAGFRLLSCVANCQSSARVIANTSSYPSERSCIVTTIDTSAGGGLATAFSFVVVGVQQ